MASSKATRLGVDRTGGTFTYVLLSAICVTGKG